MAGAVSIITTPNQTIQYTGGETKRSAQLSAPSGTPLDSKDAAFCQSKSFSKIDSPFGKAPVGTCR
jgi:hypothetical protein